MAIVDGCIYFWEVVLETTAGLWLRCTCPNTWYNYWSFQCMISSNNISVKERKKNSKCQIHSLIQHDSLWSRRLWHLRFSCSLVSWSLYLSKSKKFSGIGGAPGWNRRSSLDNCESTMHFIHVRISLPHHQGHGMVQGKGASRPPLLWFVLLD